MLTYIYKRLTQIKGEKIMRNERLKMMITAAMFAGIIAVAAQVMIAIPPVPFSLLTIAVMLTATILPKEYACLAIIIYILLGLGGIPVFAGMTGGPGILLGPTGGYILATLPAVICISFLLDMFGHNKFVAIGANMLSVVIILSIGMVWLKMVSGISWEGAFKGGMLIFLIPDLVKSIVAALVGVVIRRRLVQAKLIRATPL